MRFVPRHRARWHVVVRDRRVGHPAEPRLEADGVLMEPPARRRGEVEHVLVVKRVEALAASLVARVLRRDADRLQAHRHLSVARPAPRHRPAATRPGRVALRNGAVRGGREDVAGAARVEVGDTAARLEAVAEEQGTRVCIRGE